MDFNYLDNESELLLLELSSYDCVRDKIVEGEAIKSLIEHDFVRGNDITTTSSPQPCYLLISLTQKGKSYFEMKKKHESELKRISRREWAIGIIGAVIGYFLPIVIDCISKSLDYLSK